MWRFTCLIYSMSLSRHPVITGGPPHGDTRPTPCHVHGGMYRMPRYTRVPPAYRPPASFLKPHRSQGEGRRLDDQNERCSSCFLLQRATSCPVRLDDTLVHLCLSSRQRRRHLTSGLRVPHQSLMRWVATPCTDSDRGLRPQRDACCRRVSWRFRIRLHTREPDWPSHYRPAWL